MQTFLPYESYEDSAKVLDNKRLGKQRVENLQIMKALTVPTYGWKNHPAVKMWANYELALMEYQVAICTEWTDRGFNDTCLIKTLDILDAQLGPFEFIGHYITPPWTGDDRLYASHRSNLLRKDAAWYGKFGWTEPDDLEYFWPTKHEDT